MCAWCACLTQVQETRLIEYSVILFHRYIDIACGKIEEVCKETNPANIKDTIERKFTPYTCSQYLRSMNFVSYDKF